MWCELGSKGLIVFPAMRSSITIIEHACPLSSSPAPSLVEMYINLCNRTAHPRFPSSKLTSFMHVPNTDSILLVSMESNTMLVPGLDQRPTSTFSRIGVNLGGDLFFREFPTRPRHKFVTLSHSSGFFSMIGSATHHRFVLSLVYVRCWTSPGLL